MQTKVMGVLVVAMLSAASVASAEEKLKPTGYRIVNGAPADISQHPWQVALRIKHGGEADLCGGAIIARRWLVSAAHCFGAASQAQGVQAKAGVANYQANGIWLDAERVIVHKDYNPKTQENDIALIKLTSPAAGVKVDLAEKNMVIPANQDLEVTGWGTTTEGGAASDVLMKANVPYVENSTCNKPANYKGAIKAGMMCAGYPEGGTDACQGDSGGPLVWRQTEQHPVLVGIVSFGEGCARKHKFGIYTRVSAYRDWVDQVLSADGD